MLQLLISVVIAFIILLLTEVLARKKVLSPEVPRKITHIAAGVVIATWPFFVDMQVIAGFGLLFLAAAILVREFNLFSSSRNVDRLSWGELFFPIGVTVVALLHPSKWIFVAAMLHLGVADAVAALIGKAKGKRRYKILGYSKTVEGSVAFIIVSVLITMWAVLLAPTGLAGSWPVIIWLPFVAAGVEAVTPFGLDNILIPLLIVLALR